MGARFQANEGDERQRRLVLQAVDAFSSVQTPALLVYRKSAHILACIRAEPHEVAEACRTLERVAGILCRRSPQRAR